MVQDSQWNDDVYHPTLQYLDNVLRSKFSPAAESFRLVVHEVKISQGARGTRLELSRPAVLSCFVSPSPSAGEDGGGVPASQRHVHRLRQGETSPWI